MKKVLGLAAAGLLAAGAAQAGQITVANTDMVLYGGVSASYDWQNSEHSGIRPNDNKDNFRVTSFAIGLMKKADPNSSPIGFNAAFANFAVPTVVASPDFVNKASPDFVNTGNLIVYGDPSEFKPWLAYVTIAPVEGLSIDAGLLWAKYGEKPLTILSPNYNRGALFVLFDPVLFAGARVNYDAGMVKVYAGYNQGGGLFQENVKDAIEAGVMGDLGEVKLGLHMYDESAGRNIYTLCAKTNLGIVKGGLQFSYAKKDDTIKITDKDNNYWGIGLNLDPVVAQGIEIPIRIEYVNTDAKKDDKLWTFTITPTYKPTNNTFARVELAYTKSDKNNFFQELGTGSAKSSRTVLAFEAGFLF